MAGDDDDEFLRFQAELAAVEAETTVADGAGDKEPAASGDAVTKKGTEKEDGGVKGAPAAAPSAKLPPPPLPPPTTTTTKLPPPPPASTKPTSTLSFVPAAVARPRVSPPLPVVKRPAVVVAAPAVAGPVAPLPPRPLPPAPPPLPQQQQQFYPAPPPPPQQQQFYPRPPAPPPQQQQQQYGGYTPYYHQQQQQAPYLQQQQQQAFAAGTAAVAAATVGAGNAAGGSASTSDKQQQQQQQQNPTKKRALPRMMGGEAWYDPKLAEWPENDFRIFVGDVGADVDDAQLAAAFSKFPSFAMARVVRDRRTGKNRGYGFASFTDPADGAAALRAMDGKHIGQRPVRLRKSTWEERSGEGAAGGGGSRLPSKERFKKHCIVPRADSLRKGKGAGGF